MNIMIKSKGLLALYLSVSIMGCSDALAQDFYPIQTPPLPQNLGLVCRCEHFESPLDGICEATVSGLDNRPDLKAIYQWEAFGGAYMPFPADIDSGGAYYDVWQAGQGGGLKVDVSILWLVSTNMWGYERWAHLYSFDQRICRLGTVGGPNP
jgi:hypothetical protein